VSEHGIRNALSHRAGPQKIRLVGILPEMLRDGIPITSLANYKNPQITDHFYASKVQMDGEDYLVGSVVHEDQTGRRFYDHELTQIKKLDSRDSAAPTRSNTGGGQNQNRASVISIIHQALKSKSVGEVIKAGDTAYLPGATTPFKIVQIDEQTGMARLQAQGSGATTQTHVKWLVWDRPTPESIEAHKRAVADEQAAREWERRKAMRKEAADELARLRDDKRRYERSRNYHIALEKLKNPNIRPRTRESLEAVLKADQKYQEMIDRVKRAQKRDTLYGNEEFRNQKIRDAEAGRIDKGYLEYAPLSALPEAIGDRIRQDAKFLLDDPQTGESARSGLRKILDGRDRDADAIEQKQRIIERLTGKRGVRNANEPPPPADPLMEMYLDPNGSEHARRAIESMDAGRPNADARQLLEEIRTRMDNGETFGLQPANADAELPPEAAGQVARKWLEEIGGQAEPKADTGTDRRVDSQEAQAEAGREVQGKGKMTLEDAFGQDQTWDQKVANARKIIALAGQGGIPGIGLNQEVVKAWGVIGADLIRRGFNSIGKFAKELVRRYGRSIVPQVNSIWSAAKNRELRRQAISRQRPLEIPADRTIKLPAVWNTEEIVANVAAWAKEKGIYGEYRNPWDAGKEDTRPILVNQKTIEGAIRHRSGAQKIRLVGIIPEMLQKSVWVEARENQKNPLISDDIYAVKVRMDGQTYMVGLLVHSVTSDKKVRRFYDHEMIEIERLEDKKTVDPSDSDAQAHIRVEPVSKSKDRPYIISIIHDFVNVKSGWSNVVSWAERVIETHLRGGKPLTGLSPELIGAYTVLGADVIRSGVVTLNSWTRRMIALIGSDRMDMDAMRRIYQASKVYYQDVVTGPRIKKWNKRQKEENPNQAILFEEDELPAPSDTVRKRKQAAKALGDLVDDMEDVSGWMAYTYDVHRIFKPLARISHQAIEAE